MTGVLIANKQGKFLIIPETSEEIDQINCMLYMISKLGDVETISNPNNGRIVVPVFDYIENAQAFITTINNMFLRIRYKLLIDCLTKQLLSDKLTDI